MARIELNEFEDTTQTTQSDRIEQVGPGRKVVLAVGHEYFVINSKPVVSIRFVCIEDLEGNGDEGNILTDTFFLNEKAVWRIARYALATSWREPFDPEIQDELEQVMMAGAVTVAVKLEKNGEYTNRRVNRYDSSDYGKKGSKKLNADQKSLVEKAESHWEGYLSWRSKNPRAGQPTPARSTNKSNDYEDIPF
jgi:hypothetical protein